MRLSGINSLIILLALATAPPSVAQQPTAPGTIPFEIYQLDNGLEVILAQDHSVPVVAVDVWYHVGAANERPGLTGFAHLFEHMMFQGSENVEKGEHMQLVERAGGSMNGSTAVDRTNYFETLPANRLNLGLWLEADRMRSLAITAENLENQREVVKEERRLRVDNAPYGVSIRSSLSTVPYNSETCFAYGHETIGSMDDLNAADPADVQRFFNVYYAPGNATLAVVGDFDPDRVRTLIEEYFAEIPAGPPVPEVECEQPFSDLPVQKTFQDANANLPALFLTYGLPAAGSPDVYPLRLLAAVLAGGESSRLHQRLVREEQSALQVLSVPDFRKGPGILLIGAIANQGVEPAQIEAVVEEELATVRAEGISAAELEKAKNQYRSQVIRQLQTALGKAEALHQANMLYGDPAAVRTDLAKTLAVSLEDIQRVAVEYLTPDNRATVITEPAPAAKE
ncbi:MAG TPA: pitrilysin family protein [Longimicrobiaceae bacterium]|nr:pitrilysin family protein [Longimicrobiaceae bacterium]